MPDKKIFIVEDEPIVAMMLEDTLGQLGYTVSGTATNGKDAIGKIGELRPDLILMDIRIEGDMDGIETAEKVTSLYHVPVVYLTAHSDEKTLERAMATQPHGYLLKPFRTRELYSTIEIALYKHRLMGRGPEQPMVPAATAAGATAPPRERAERQTTVTIEHAVLDAMGPAVFVVNREMKLVYFNPACEALFLRLGFPQAAPGLVLQDVASPALVGSAKEFAGIFGGGRTRENTVALRIGERPASLSCEKIPLAEAGAVTYIAGIVRDTTHEKLTEEQLLGMYAHCDAVLARLAEITTLTSGNDDPAMKKIAEHVSDIVIAITKQDGRMAENPAKGESRATR